MGYKSRKVWCAYKYHKQMSNKTKVAIALVAIVAAGYFFVMPALKKSSGLG